MNKTGKIICVFLAVLFCMAFAAGCGTGSAAGTDAQPTKITTESTGVFSETPEPVATSAPTPTPEPTPSPTPEVTSSLPQLQAKDGYMKPKSLGGIDPMNDKVVALTFDDGPHGTLTPKLLDILKDNGVVATFFMLGENAEKYPDIVKRAYDEGNEIGTHSWNHKDLKKLSLDQIMQDQYGKANDAIEAATGLRALIDRPPYGSMTEDLAAQIGREQVMWSVDPNDWKTENRNPDTVYNNVVKGTSDGGSVTDGAIVLSHDIHETTVQAYDRIIKALKEEGYQFVTVTQMMQIAEIRGKEIQYRFSSAPTAKEAKEAASAGSAEE